MIKFSSLSILAAALALCAPIAQAEPEQLLKNSSFTEGDVGWKLEGGIEVTNETGPDGAPILYFKGDPVKTLATSSPFPVTPKATYLFAMWARSVTDGQGGATIRFLDKSNKVIAGQDQTNGVGAGEDDWKNVEISFTAPEGAVSAILIMNGGSTGPGRFEISNPKVYTATPDM